MLAAIRRASSRVSSFAADLGLLSEWAFVTKTEALYPPGYTEVQVSLLSRTIECDSTIIPTVASLGLGGTPIPDRIVCRPNCRLCGVPHPPR